MSQGQKDSKKNFVMIVGIIAAVGLALFAYLMFYVSPEETVERVKVIAVTQEGCIAETMDGFSMNIGDCQADPGQFINAVVDQKVKERAAAMNPTS